MKKDRKKFSNSKRVSLNYDNQLELTSMGDESPPESGMSPSSKRVDESTFLALDAEEEKQMFSYDNLVYPYNLAIQQQQIAQSIILNNRRSKE